MMSSPDSKAARSTAVSSCNCKVRRHEAEALDLETEAALPLAHRCRLLNMVTDSETLISGFETENAGIDCERIPFMYRRIIVPLDGSVLAESALPEAEKLAKLTGAELVLVRVIDFSSRDRFADFGLLYEYEAMARALEEERQLATTYLADTSGPLSEKGHTVSAQLVDGIASKAIVNLTEPGDVIVMATHGRTGMRRWFIGSIAEDVLRHSTVPVLLVRAADDSQPPTGGK